MATATSSNNGSLSPLGVFYQREPLRRLVAKTVYYNLAHKKTLEKNMGRNYTWVVGAIQSADTNILTEGVPVVPTNVSSSAVSATIQEYGNALAASSLLGNTSIVETDKFLRDQIEQKGAYTIDQLMRNEVFNSANTFGTNQFAANNKGSIANITSADTLANSDVRRLHFWLENNNVPTYKNGKYAMVISVGQRYDVTNSSTAGGFLDLAKQNPAGIQDIKKAMYVRGADLDETDPMTDEASGEVEPLGEYNGMVLFATSLNPIINNGSVNVHYAAAWGDQSLGAIELDNEKFKLFRVEGGTGGGMFDILQMMKLAIGYKVAFAAKNLSQDSTTPAYQRVLTMGSAISLF